MGVQRSHVFVGVSLVFVLGCYGLAAAQSTVTVATYAVDRYEIMRDVLLPQWQEKYPDIDIEVQLYPGFFDRMLVVMGTEHAPDIIDTAGTYLFGHVVRGGAVDLSPYIERDPELSPDDFWEGPWNEARWPQPDGASIFALPYDTVGTVLWYNKSLLSSAGVAFPDEEWTWFDVRDASRKIARDRDGDGVNDIWGFNPNVGHTSYDLIVKSFGGQILSPDRRRAAINSEKAAEATQFMADFLLQDGTAAIGPAFTQGNVGLSVDGTYSIRNVAAVEGLEWGATLTPKGPERRVAYGGSNMWEVMKRPGQDMDAVWTVLKELLSKETIVAFWTSYLEPYSLPGTSRVASEVHLTELQLLLVESIPYMEDANWSPDWAVWQAAKRAEITPVMNGTVSVEEALMRAEQAINNVLDQAYAD